MQANYKNQVVITGMGVICSIGMDIPSFTSSLRNGISGLRTIPAQRMNTEHAVYKNKQACILKDAFFLDCKKHDVTVLRYAAGEAVREALTSAGLDGDQLKKEITGLCIGTSVGASFSYMEFLKRRIAEDKDCHQLQYNLGPTVAGSIAKDFHINGPITTISTACASGTNSIGRAFDYIRDNRADIMIAGGIDVFNEMSFSGFNSLQALSIGQCKPFDKNRDGLNLGDALAFVIVESKEHALQREAPILARIAGYSILNEAHHATAPSPNGETAILAMKTAMEEGKISLEDIDYVNAHGTATKANDSMEIRALSDLFQGSSKPVYLSSTKSMTGHTLGAAGSLELIACIVGMQDGFIPPSLHVAEPIIEDGNFILVREPDIEKNIQVALSNSFGFAGNIATIVITKN